MTLKEELVSAGDNSSSLTALCMGVCFSFISTVDRLLSMRYNYSSPLQHIRTTLLSRDLFDEANILIVKKLFLTKSVNIKMHSTN